MMFERRTNKHPSMYPCCMVINAYILTQYLFLLLCMKLDNYVVLSCFSPVNVCLFLGRQGRVLYEVCQRNCKVIKPDIAYQQSKGL